MINSDRREGIVGIMTECRKETLKQYLKSYGLPVSGTKLQLAMRIWDKTKTYKLQIQMAPGGTVSIGIALDLLEEDQHEQKSKQQNRTVTEIASTF